MEQKINFKQWQTSLTKLKDRAVQSGLITDNGHGGTVKEFSGKD